MFRSRWAVAPLIALVLPAVASAHAVGLDVKLKDNAVRVEAYYDDDTPAADAKVTIETADKAVVAEGKTDDKGVWTCPAPPAGKYVVRVDAGDGHRAKTTIVVPAATEAPPPPAEPVSISDGPTRDEFTGPMKWVWAAVGLAVIGVGTLAARRLGRTRTAAVVALFAASPASAHYHMLFPDKPSAKAGEAVTFTYQFGHPFEHELSDTAKPEKLYVVEPDGTRTDLAGKLEQATADGEGGKKVTVWRFAFAPAKRGDYTVVAVSPAPKPGGEKVWDATKVILHVQTQNGWDRPAGGHEKFELTPLTRPYGLTPGTAFHVEVETDVHPTVERQLIEVERYNPAPPKEMPADELVTRVSRVSRTGAAVVTLPEPGWWGITAVRGQHAAGQRTTLWVHVDPAK